MTAQPRSDENVPAEAEGHAAVFGLAATPGFRAGQAGQAFAATRAGLKRSDDGGKTWDDAPLGLVTNGPLPVTSVVISPDFEHDGLVFAGTAGGILHSVRGHDSWKTVIFPPPSPSVSALAISPDFADDQCLFAGTLEDGVFVSENGGKHWHSWNFGLLDLNILALAISPNYRADDTLFAGAETGLFRSTSGGRAWREVELPFGFDPVISLAVSPNYAEDGSLYIGCENHGLWTSADEGDHWTRLSEETLTDPVNSILVSGNYLAAATGDGLWHSANGRSPWINRLPRALRSQGLSTVLAPQGVGPGSTVLAGFLDGGIHPVAMK